MIVKSFFRKKNTRIYTIILGLIFLILFILGVGKNYYIKQVNKDYDGSFSYFKSNDSIDLNYINNILMFQKGFELSIDNSLIYFAIDNNVPKGKIILPSNYKNEIGLGDSISLITKYSNQDLLVYDYYESIINFPIFKINSEDYQKLSKDQNIVYFFQLKNWLDMDETISKIEQDLDVTVVTYLSDNETSNYKFIITIVDIFIYFMILIFIITGCISIYNVINDEKKNMMLYRCLGYSKLENYLILLKKIFFLIFFSLIPTMIISILLFLVF